MDGRHRRHGGPRPSARRGCAAPTSEGHPAGRRSRCWASGCPRRAARGRGRMTAIRRRLPAAPGSGGAGAVPRRADHQDPSAGGPPLRPVARVTTAGQRHDSLASGPLMNRLRIARAGPGRPRTRPGRLLGDKAYSSKKIRAHLRRRRITATIPSGRPDRPPHQTGPQRRPATCLRCDRLQRSQHHRACLQQAQGFPRSGHAHRQTRLHLPRHRQHRHDQDLAPRPSPQRSMRHALVRRGLVSGGSGARRG